MKISLFILFFLAIINSLFSQSNGQNYEYFVNHQAWGNTSSIKGLILSEDKELIAITLEDNSVRLFKIGSRNTTYEYIVRHALLEPIGATDIYFQNDNKALYCKYGKKKTNGLK